MPSSRPVASARPLAAHGKTALSYSGLPSFACASVIPTQAISGPYMRPRNGARIEVCFLARDRFGGDLASCEALCASIGSPTISPIAKIFGMLVRIACRPG